MAARITQSRAARITQSRVGRVFTECGWHDLHGIMRSEIRDKSRPVLIQNGTRFLFHKYGTIPYFKGRVATLGFEPLKLTEDKI